ncbi:hypothetical protein DFJ73DRAFT_287514 [Zopfochytrium polystomum]|nr:hypothetical protein DFJ73DRAFT_287514 [Zopfochytrium polystomum]
MWITECLERLNEISRTRAALLPEYRSLLSESSPIGYVSLVRRVLSNALAPDAQAAGTQTAAANAAASGALDAASGGLSHVSYGGTLGSVISGFSRLLGGARPTPASFGTVIVFAVGGITVGEVRDLKEVAKERGVKLLVGSTAVIDGNVIMRNLFPPIPGL